MVARVRLAILVVLLAMATVCAAASQAEFVQSGKLLVSFDAGIKPTKLPRSQLVPVKIGFRGTFENLDASDTPALRTMIVRLSDGGRIHSRGLPVCPRARIRDLDASGALRACRRAKIGEGTIRSAFRFPDGRRGRSRARLLLFNARGGIVMHVHTTRPLEGIFLVPMTVRRARGAFGTILRARFPRIAAGYGYLTGFEMVIDRSFRAGGRRHSYAVASCPVPRGFGRKATFELAQVVYRFANGITIRNSAVRSCTVRGR